MSTVGAQISAAFYKPFVSLTPWTFLLAVAGVVLLSTAFGLSHHVKRRRFYRKNSTGVEQFDSYGKAVVTRVGEGLLVQLALFMALASCLSLGAAYLGFMAGRLL